MRQTIVFGSRYTNANFGQEKDGEESDKSIAIAGLGLARHRRRLDRYPWRDRLYDLQLATQQTYGGKFHPDVNFGIGCRCATAVCEWLIADIAKDTSTLSPVTNVLGFF